MSVYFGDKNMRVNSALAPHWWRKSIAGVVLGFTLALGISGLFAWLGPGGIAAPDKTQFVMWSIAPLWMTVLSSVFLFRTGNQALLLLVGTNMVVYTLLYVVTSILGAS